MSEDPIGLAAGINPFVFAGGNPVSGRDPSGLSYLCRGSGEITIWYGWTGMVMDAQVTWNDWECTEIEDEDGEKRKGGGGAGGGNSTQDPDAGLRSCSIGPFRFKLPEEYLSVLPSATWFLGTAIDLVWVGGPTGGAGFFVDSQGFGLYGRNGWQVGADVGVAAIEGGRSTAFFGKSTEVAAGWGPFAFSLGRPAPRGTSGWTFSGVVGVAVPQPGNVRGGESTTRPLRLLTCER